MRSREFVTEQRGRLDPGQKSALVNTYVIPGLTSQDPYKTYRFGLALARARALGKDYDLPTFAEEGAFGELAVISGQEDLGDLIDAALQLAGISGGKKLIGSKHSHETQSINTQSPVKGFQGYTR